MQLDFVLPCWSIYTHIKSIGIFIEESAGIVLVKSRECRNFVGKITDVPE